MSLRFFASVGWTALAGVFFSCSKGSSIQNGLLAGIHVEADNSTITLSTTSTSTNAQMGNALLKKAPLTAQEWGRSLASSALTSRSTIAAGDQVLEAVSKTASQDHDSAQLHHPKIVFRFVLVPRLYSSKILEP